MIPKPYPCLDVTPTAPMTLSLPAYIPIHPFFANWNFAKFNLFHPDYLLSYGIHVSILPISQMLQRPEAPNQVIPELTPRLPKQTQRVFTLRLEVPRDTLKLHTTMFQACNAWQV